MCLRETPGEKLAESGVAEPRNGPYNLLVSLQVSLRGSQEAEYDRKTRDTGFL
jgi:hypothetical protein